MNIIENMKEKILPRSHGPPWLAALSYIAHTGPLIIKDEITKATKLTKNGKTTYWS